MYSYAAIQLMLSISFMFSSAFTLCWRSLPIYFGQERGEKKNPSSQREFFPWPDTRGKCILMYEGEYDIGIVFFYSREMRIFIFQFACAQAELKIEYSIIILVKTVWYSGPYERGSAGTKFKEDRFMFYRYINSCRKRAIVILISKEIFSMSKTQQFKAYDIRLCQAMMLSEITFTRLYRISFSSSIGSRYCKLQRKQQALKERAL